MLLNEKLKSFSHAPAAILGLRAALVQNYVDTILAREEKYRDSKRLTKFEYGVYSESGEDGIIDEIFKRIGTTNRYFVEVGVSDGLQCNTTYLLVKDWAGLWLESNARDIRRIRRKFRTLINSSKLAVKETFVTAENIEGLLDQGQVPREFDLLSIDIDGNDYWVWKAVSSYRARAVVIEYNAIFRPDVKWVVKYRSDFKWDRTSYFGASLRSLEVLGASKGYRLVGCTFAGVNCFFVREDLVRDKFCEPFSAENHYEPPRYYLLGPTGHRRNFGDFESG